VECVNLNNASKQEKQERMPQTAAFLAALRASMDAHIPGSSRGMNGAMVAGVHGTANCFHFVETAADGVSYEVGTAYTSPRAVVATHDMVLRDAD
jgi:hypothetical protein